MKDKIELLLEKNCKFIEMNMKNGDNLSIDKPNQNGINTLNIVIKKFNIPDSLIINMLDSKRVVS